MGCFDEQRINPQKLKKIYRTNDFEFQGSSPNKWGSGFWFYKYRFIIFVYRYFLSKDLLWGLHPIVWTEIILQKLVHFQSLALLCIPIRADQCYTVNYKRGKNKNNATAIINNGRV